MEALPYLPYLMKQNIALFAMDFAGCGISEGNYISLGLSEQNDLDCAIRYLDEMFTFEEYFIWGRSMGAVTALLYQSNAKHHPIRSKKVFCEYPPMSRSQRWFSIPPSSRSDRCASKLVTNARN